MKATVEEFCALATPEVVLIKHSEMVDTLVKPGNVILEQMTEQKAHCAHMAMGVAGEGGELLDAIKKWTMYNKDLDRENVIEELGDLEFFMDGLRKSLGITRDETLRHNIKKLGVRYKDFRYTDEQAHARADKKVCGKCGNPVPDFLVEKAAREGCEISGWICSTCEPRIAIP